MTEGPLIILQCTSHSQCSVSWRRRRSRAGRTRLGVPPPPHTHVGTVPILRTLLGGGHRRTMPGKSPRFRICAWWDCLPDTPPPPPPEPCLPLVVSPSLGTPLRHAFPDVPFTGDPFSGALSPAFLVPIPRFFFWCPFPSPVPVLKCPIPGASFP